MKKVVLAAVVAAVAAALVLVVAGCGSSKSSSSTSQSSSGQSTADRTAFRQCLQAHGVTPPSGPPQPGQAPSFDSKTRAAFQACSQYRPARPQGQGGFGQGQGTFSG
jgi:Flp pilus assembly protein TadD